MRGVSLPNPEVLSLLDDKFVVAWTNIRRKKYVGNSYGYGLTDSAVGTTNGAGAHNVQILMLSPDLHVLHALPGFWHPQDLARELRLALELHRLWRDQGRSPEQKRDMYRRLQLSAVRHHPTETFARSGWQGFDVHAETTKRKLGERDTFFAQGRVKPINVIVHERMASRPFQALSSFDIESFADIGKKFYDLNAQVDGRGKPFPTAAAAAQRADAKLYKELGKVMKAEARERARLGKLAKPAKMQG
ncbi:MAG: hypothetical protein H6836_00885 [Planctomycetes bacterium]|nr:hypothetical protein [Planctomycetota bacterium]MCB9888097.1 hypothetical protein [Planctomycetota bacterium]